MCSAPPNVTRLSASLNVTRLLPVRVAAVGLVLVLGDLCPGNSLFLPLVRNAGSLLVLKIFRALAVGSTRRVPLLLARSSIGGTSSLLAGGVRSTPNWALLWARNSIGGGASVLAGAAGVHLVEEGSTT